MCKLAQRVAAVVICDDFFETRAHVLDFGNLDQEA